jgi:hypothetical protein
MSDGEGDTGSSGSTGGEDGDDGGEGGPLPDPRTDAGFDAGCTDVDGVKVPGATSFFYGQFEATAEPDVWQGEEQWLLFANDTWREYGEDDCAITWTAVATRSDAAGTCGDCSYGLTVSASIDLARTSCPEGLYAGEESFEVVYGVRVSGSTATYVFAQSGTTVGTGHAEERGSNYLSQASCTWF